MSGATGGLICDMDHLERIYVLSYMAGMAPDLFRRAREAWRQEEDEETAGGAILAS
jgi:hypothetical protein